MNFELHITFGSEVTMFDLQNIWCRLHPEAKPLYFSLPGAFQAIQPMFALKGTSETIDQAIEWMHSWMIEANEKARVTRAKLESDFEYPKSWLIDYTEAHWKVGPEIIGKSRPGFMLSRNLITGDYFLTKRHLTRGIIDSSLPYENHHEVVIIDTNKKLDEGWLIL